jgi:hypothetical protein
MVYEMQQICRDKGPAIVMAFTRCIAAAADRPALNKLAAK